MRVVCFPESNFIFNNFISPAGCEKGYHSSCLSAGILDAAKVDHNYIRKDPPNPSQARESYRKACDEGNIAEACHRLSAFYIKGLPQVCEKNMQEAFKYSLKGEGEGSFRNIFYSVVSACELGNLGGCVNVSIMYSKGEGTDKNPVAAKVGTEILILF